jgi:hypothetical protein
MITWDTGHPAAINVENKMPEILTNRLRAHLQEMAARGLAITYGEMARELGLIPPNTIHQLTQALEELMAEDSVADRPFIAAMVISKMRKGLPAPGFFDCAAQLGRFVGEATGENLRVYYEAEFNAVLAWCATTKDTSETE